VALDCEYISTAGLQLDLRIILCTILRVFGLRGGRSVRLLGLQRTVRLSANAAPIGGQPDAPPVTPETIVIYKAGGATITYDDIRSFSQEGDDRPESSTPAASTSPSLSKI
jgi:hypothetical protein